MVRGVLHIVSMILIMSIFMALFVFTYFHGDMTLKEFMNQTLLWWVVLVGLAILNILTRES